MLNFWNRIPTRLRTGSKILAKLALTFGAFYLLFNHSIQTEDGQTIKIIGALQDNIAKLEMGQFLPWLGAAALIKVCGIGCSMLRWHLLLIGQGIRFNFTHIVGAFLIGRFLGTFLPSTLGLDGYKLYDAARFSQKSVECAAATVVEKVMGLAGIFLSFLITLPLGFHILGENAVQIALFTVPVALGIIGGLFLLLWRPALVEWGVSFIPKLGRSKIETFINRASNAAAGYKGNTRLLSTVLGLSFIVHFTTAAMYYFTALAVGAVGADFWAVCFASSIQIFATVISPFTIAGEGVREIVQALLLAKHIGASQSILSAALGFWAAEALTLFGAYFWWKRKDGYKPKRVGLTTNSSLNVAGVGS